MLNTMETPGVSRTLSALLGGNKDVALLEAFALRDEQALTASDAVELSGMAWATAHRRIKDWTDSGVLSEVGRTGKAPLYRLNTSSAAVYALVRGLKLIASELFESDLMAEQGLVERELAGEVFYRFSGSIDELRFEDLPAARLDGRLMIPSQA